MIKIFHSFYDNNIYLHGLNGKRKLKKKSRYLWIINYIRSLKTAKELFAEFSNAINVQKKAKIISINIKLKKKDSKLSRADA